MTEERIHCDNCNALIAVLKRPATKDAEQLVRHRKWRHKAMCGDNRYTALDEIEERQ